MAELRSLKRRTGIAEETVRIKKERLDEAEQEYEEEHQTFTIFSKRLEEKWEQRFDVLARMARDAGVRSEDIEAVRLQPWRAAPQEQHTAAAEREAAVEREAEKEAALQQAATRAEAEKEAALQQAAAKLAATEAAAARAADEAAAKLAATEAAAARAADEAAAKLAAAEATSHGTAMRKEAATMEEHRLHAQVELEIERAWERAAADRAEERDLFGLSQRDNHHADTVGKLMLESLAYQLACGHVRAFSDAPGFNRLVLVADYPRRAAVGMELGFDDNDQSSFWFPAEVQMVEAELNELDVRNFENHFVDTIYQLGCKGMIDRYIIDPGNDQWERRLRASCLFYLHLINWHPNAAGLSIDWEEEWRRRVGLTSDPWSGLDGESGD